VAATRLLKESVRLAAKTVFAAADVPYRVRPGPRILIYHQIGAGLGRQMEVTEEAFESQVRWLTENGTIVSLQEALDRAGEPGSEELFVLTFDDGYRDMYEKAVPLLASEKIPFTVYVTTRPVETGEPLFPGGRADPVSWSELEAMQSELMTVGAHTHTHPDLRAVDSDTVERELDESDRLIEERLSVRPEHFCYPYGYWSSSADGAVRSRYRSATLGAGGDLLADTDPYLVPRIPIQLSDGMFFFKRKMRSGMRLEEVVRRRVAGYDGVTQDA
jgi:peptidoglycan/xylan/chitin deacetylase (PgdA/CDA1 family)